MQRIVAVTAIDRGKRQIADADRIVPRSGIENIRTAKTEQVVIAFSGDEMLCGFAAFECVVIRCTGDFRQFATTTAFAKIAAAKNDIA